MLSRHLLSSKNITKVCTSKSMKLDSLYLCQNFHPILTHLTREFHEVVGDILCPVMNRGADFINNPRLYKGLAFTLRERQKLGINGLLPPRVKSIEEQLYLLRQSVDRYSLDLNKYIYLNDVHDRNETLFFRFLTDNVEDMMPIVYTPTVGLACQKYGLIYRRPRGLFVNIHDRGHLFDVFKCWPEPNVRAIVVTDGERILGLGDLGAYGMGIPVGKLALYTALAGIKPHQCLPILLDVGTDNEELLNDPLYVGLRQKRVRGKEYDDFLEEFMEAVVQRYDQNTLIQFEDFGSMNAHGLLDKYRDRYCTFNDDIQGTGAVIVSGLLASIRLTKKKLKEHNYLFAGAGSAAIGIAQMIEKALQQEGLSIQEARDKIWMVDVHGLLTTDRDPNKVDRHQKPYLKNHRSIQNLEEITEDIKPSVLLGATAQPGIFTPAILTSMAKYNERPLIFALSNPTEKCECTAEDAYKYTEGRAIFSSGSPFPEFDYKGKIYKPGQGNNAYIFPGLALGVIVSKTHHIPDDMFLVAAQVLADSTTDDCLERGSLYPPLKNVRKISLDIGLKILQYAYSNGYASVYPEPCDKEMWIKKQTYSFEYENFLPRNWHYPEQSHPLIENKITSSN